MANTHTHTENERRRILAAIEMYRKSAEESRSLAQYRRESGDAIGADFCEMDASYADEDRTVLECQLAVLGDKQ